MNHALICDAIRTPIGRYAGALSSVRADDLAAIPIRELIQRNQQADWSRLDDLVYGCANQAGEDNRNVARMATLLAGLPISVPAVTVNRLCGSGLDAVNIAARSIACGEQHLVIAGGVESMSRAPFVSAKACNAFDRSVKTYDTTMGWRFINPLLKAQYGVDSMPETAENVAEQFTIKRSDQDAFALRSQQRTSKAQNDGFFDAEIVPVSIPQRKSDDLIVNRDEHPRSNTTLEALSQLPTPFKPNGTVTAGNASGINDGACALLLASPAMAKSQSLQPKARVIATCCVGVEPCIMGYAPAPAISKLLQQTKLQLNQIDVIEINEAFAAQCLAVTRDLGLQDDDSRVNPNGGAIALGHPLGMSGARLVTTAVNQLQRNKGRYAICAMCIGVGQGIAMLIETV